MEPIYLPFDFPIPHSTSTDSPSGRYSVRLGHGKTAMLSQVLDSPFGSQTPLGERKITFTRPDANALHQWIAQAGSALEKYGGFCRFLTHWSASDTDLSSLNLFLDRLKQRIERLKTCSDKVESSRLCEQLNHSMWRWRNLAVDQLLTFMKAKPEVPLATDKSLSTNHIAKLLQNSLQCRQRLDAHLREYLKKAQELLPSGERKRLSRKERSNLMSLSAEFNSRLDQLNLSALYEFEIDGRRFAPLHPEVQKCLEETWIPLLLHQSTQVRRVVLRHLRASSKTLEALRELPRLRHLAFHHCPTDSLTPIASLRTLRSLVLSQISTGAGEASPPRHKRTSSMFSPREPSIVPPSSLGFLQELPLTRLRLEGVPDLSHAALAQVPSSLKALTLHQCGFQPGHSLQGLGHLSLESLTLSQTAGSPEHLDLTELREVSLEGRNISAAEWIRKLTQKAPHLETLDLHQESIPARAWADALKQEGNPLKTLKELKILRMGPATPMSLGALGTLAPKLRILSLEQGSLSMEEIKELKSHFRKLSALGMGSDARCFEELHLRPFLTSELVADTLKLQLMKTTDLENAFEFAAG